MSDESHDKQFRGLWIPPEILSLLEEGTISAKEMALLAVIESLVSKDRGCFASNEYLGKRIQTSADRVSKMVTHLKRLGLIRQVAYNGRQRFIETL